VPSNRRWYRIEVSSSPNSCHLRTWRRCLHLAPRMDFEWAIFSFIWCVQCAEVELNDPNRRATRGGMNMRRLQTVRPSPLGYPPPPIATEPPSSPSPSPSVVWYCLDMKLFTMGAYMAGAYRCESLWLALEFQCLQNRGTFCTTHQQGHSPLYHFLSNLGGVCLMSNVGKVGGP